MSLDANFVTAAIIVTLIQILVTAALARWGSAIARRQEGRWWRFAARPLR